VTFFVPGGSSIAQYNAKLTQEIATAKNIKSKATRSAVLEALKSIKTALGSGFKNVAPENGIACFSGYDEKSGERILEVMGDLPMLLSSPLYRCDSKFHADTVAAMFEEQGKTYGFVVFDGSGTYIATVQGTKITKLASNQGHLPKKQSKGGQSAPRFQRLRLEARMHFRKKSEELIAKALISPQTTLPIVDGIILAGLSTFKSELCLDHRLKPLVLAYVQVAYPGKSGFYQALKNAEGILENRRIFDDIEVLKKFFKAIERDTPVVFGLRQTVQALLERAVDELILSESMRDVPFDDETSLIEYARSMNVAVSVVSEASKEGSQFQAMGGVGAILRFRLFENAELGEQDEKISPLSDQEQEEEEEEEEEDSFC